MSSFVLTTYSQGLSSTLIKYNVETLFPFTCTQLLMNNYKHPCELLNNISNKTGLSMKQSFFSSCICDVNAFI